MSLEYTVYTVWVKNACIISLWICEYWIMDMYCLTFLNQIEQTKRCGPRIYCIWTGVATIQIWVCIVLKGRLLFQFPNEPFGAIIWLFFRLYPFPINRHEFSVDTFRWKIEKVVQQMSQCWTNVAKHKQKWIWA